MSIVPRRRAASPARPLPRPHGSAAPAPRRSSLAGRLARRVLDGRHEWGALEVWGGRYGCTTSCLVVHPPGTARGERIRYRALRSWPGPGLLLAVLATVLVAHRLPFALAAAAGVAVYAAGALALTAVAGRGRRAIRTLQACRGDEGVVGMDRGPAHELDRLAAMLLEAEQRHRAGELDGVGFEAVWGAVWRELGDPRLTRI
ncbi:DUF6611 family protein [Amnibacterium kyonggiense]